MSEELIKRLHLAANGASFDGRAGDAFLMREAAHALSRPAPVQVPEGWKLVPVEPTPEMLESIANTVPCMTSDARLAYPAMLAAAPSTPVAVAPPVGWRAILNDAYDAIGAGTDSVRCNMERGYVGPVLDGICSGLERLEINAAPAAPSVDAEKVMALVEEYAGACISYGHNAGHTTYNRMTALQYRVRALLSAIPAASGWQPIETAPRDGSVFIATGFNYGKSSEPRHYCMALWEQGEWREASEWNGHSSLAYLTHWQPLSAAPADVVKPDCSTCANRGRVDGLSQETHCAHCIWQESWRTDHYSPKQENSNGL